MPPREFVLGLLPHSSPAAVVRVTPRFPEPSKRQVKVRGSLFQGPNAKCQKPLLSTPDHRSRSGAAPPLEAVDPVRSHPKTRGVTPQTVWRVSEPCGPRNKTP